MVQSSISMLLLFIVCAVGTAQEEKLKEMKGAIRELDLKVGTLTLHPLYTEKPQTFSLAAKELPVVDALGKPLKLTDLREEMRVSAKLRNDADIVGLRVEMPCMNGMIKSVDPAARSVTLKTAFADRTYRIPPKTPILAMGNEQPFEALKVGGPIQVLFAFDHKTVIQVHIGKGVNIRDPNLRLMSHYGILSDIDHAKRTVQIFEQTPDLGIVRTYPVSQHALLQTMYHLKPVSEVGFEQFAKLLKVHYMIDRDTGRIVALNADLPVMTRRKVIQFDAEKRKLVIEDDRQEKTLEVAADVKVWLPKSDGKLADIAANRIVNCALTPDRSKVQLVYVWAK